MEVRVFGIATDTVNDMMIRAFYKIKYKFLVNVGPTLNRCRSDIIFVKLFMLLAYFINGKY